MLRHVADVRNVFVRNERHHLEHGRGAVGKMGNNETTHDAKSEIKRIHLLVVLADDDEVREALLSSLLAHFHEIVSVYSVNNDSRRYLAYTDRSLATYPSAR